MGDVETVKRSARTAARERRALVEPAERADRARAITARLLATHVITGAERVGVYLALGDEPETRGFISALWSRGIDVYVPRVTSDRHFQWMALGPDTALTPGRFGIDEPSAGEGGPARIRTGDLDVIVAPALAVDRRGFRLGRGAGYFDRALAGASAPIIAIAHDEDIVDDLPQEDHDVPVDMVITPGGSFRPEPT